MTAERENAATPATVATSSASGSVSPSAPASQLRATGALAGLELRLLARRGENILATFVIPLAVLWFFSSVAGVTGVPGRPIEFFVPGAIALAIVAAGLVNLGIATAYDRSYGVLKRLGGSPMSRGSLIAGKILAVLVLELAQLIVILAFGWLALGWSAVPGWSPLIVAGALVGGTAAFAGLGLLLAGTLRAEATLALANGLFLLLLLLGGIVLPVDHLPAVLQPLASVLPSTALADLLRIGFGAPAAMDLGSAGFLLALWALAAVALAARLFRWDEG